MKIYDEFVEKLNKKDDIPTEKKDITTYFKIPKQVKNVLK
jgi:hypothetical protein